MAAIKCTNCGAVLKTKDPIAPGKKVKCPKCAQPFVVPEEEEEAAGAEEEAGDEEDQPKKKPAKASKGDDDDGDDDDDEKPKKKKGKGDDDDDDGDEKSKKKGGSSTMIIIIVVVVLVLLCCCGCGGVGAVFRAAILGAIGLGETIVIKDVPKDFGKDVKDFKDLKDIFKDMSKDFKDITKDKKKKASLTPAPKSVPADVLARADGQNEFRPQIAALVVDQGELRILATLASRQASRAGSTARRDWRAQMPFAMACS